MSAALEVAIVLGAAFAGGMIGWAAHQLSEIRSRERLGEWLLAEPDWTPADDDWLDQWRIRP